MTTEIGIAPSEKEEFKDEVVSHLEEEFKPQIKEELKEELLPELHKNWHAAHEETFTFRDKAADSVAKWLGSWTFIIALLVFITLWVLDNVVMGVAFAVKFDPYPFILLNLFFSLQATLSTPIILMSQNRAAARDKAQAEHQWQHQELAMKENTTLTKAVKKLTEEIHSRGRVPAGLEKLIQDVREARAAAVTSKRSVRIFDRVLSYLNALQSGAADVE